VAPIHLELVREVTLICASYSVPKYSDSSMECVPHDLNGSVPVQDESFWVSETDNPTRIDVRDEAERIPGPQDEMRKGKRK